MTVDRHTRKSWSALACSPIRSTPFVSRQPTATRLPLAREQSPLMSHESELSEINDQAGGKRLKNRPQWRLMEFLHPHPSPQYQPSSGAGSSQLPRMATWTNPGKDV